MTELQDRPADVTDRWLRPAECAALIGVRVKLLSRWRIEGRGPRFSRLSRKVVVYSLSDVRSWIEACRMSSTAPNVAA